MEQLTFQPGQIIFREGEDSDCAYLIRSGQVEIYKRAPLGTVLLAELGDGEIFGEMGIVADKPRSAYASAKSQVVVERISREALSAALANQPDVIIRLINTLRERLYESGAQISLLVNKQAGFQFATGQEGPKPVKRVMLLPLTAETKAQLPPQGMQLTSLPFRIGSLPQGQEPNPLDWNNLFLKDVDENLVSRNHFVVQRGESGLHVMDRGSKAGTTVNGHFIGGNSGEYKADLQPGDNIVAAGPLDSPYRFMVVWE